MAYERLSTQRMVWRFKRPWYLRGPVWLLLAVPLLLLGRVMLSPILESATRTRLAQQRIDLRFADLDLSIFPPAYILEDVAVGREVEGGAPFRAARVEVNTSWGSLVSGKPAVQIALIGARWSASAEGAPVAELHRAAALLPRGARIATIDVEQGEIHMKGSPFPWVAGVQAAVGLDGEGGSPVTINGRGKVLGDAPLVFKIKATSPERPGHEAEVTVTGVRVGSLEGFLDRRADGLPTGALDMEARWKATDGGAVSGQAQLGASGISPAGAEPERVVPVVREAFAPVLPQVAIKRVGGGPAGATPADQVRIEGTIPAPDNSGKHEALLRAVVGTLRGALVEGLSAGIELRAASALAATSAGPAAGPAGGEPAVDGQGAPPAAPAAGVPPVARP